MPREDGIAVFFSVTYHVCHRVPLVEFENDFEYHSWRRLTISFDYVKSRWVEPFLGYIFPSKV